MSARLSARLAALSGLTEQQMRRAVCIAAPPFAHLGAIQAYHLGWYSADLAPLAEAVGGGKRLRPAICLLVCEALSGDPQPAISIAAAIELVHNFSLVHDDIQDQSGTRRHRPTVWALWGIAQAINVGDALYTAAHLSVLGDDSLAPAVRVEALRVLSEACVNLVEGQYFDLALQGGAAASLEEYEAMVGRKTAALIAASAELGAIGAGADASARQAYREFGRSLGLAFQYQDDVLGVWGDEQVTGKSAADVQSGKKGLPAVLAFRRAGPLQEAELRRLYALPAREGSAATQIVQLFEELGVRHEAEALVGARVGEAREWLRRAPGRLDIHSLLEELVESVATRSA